MDKYIGVDKFDDTTIEIIHLPIPITEELYEELYSKGILRKEELEKGSYYRGTCRNTIIAKWNGEKFVYMRYKFGKYFPEEINHLSDDNGYDLFIPLNKIHDVPECLIIKD